MRITIFGLLIAAFPFLLNAQDKAPTNWFLNATENGGYPGVGIEKTYNELLKNKKGETVVVAVIDSGVDAEHEDLQEIMWINADEIPGNGKDDDNNGYVDDVHGWNFIGGKDGKNINHDALEISRLAAKYEKMFKGKKKEDLSKKDRKKFEAYEAIKEEIDGERSRIEKNLVGINSLLEGIAGLEKVNGGPFTLEELKELEVSEELAAPKGMVSNIAENIGLEVAELKEILGDQKDHFDGQLNYYYNPDFDPRGIVGDNYSNPNEKYYGNSDVEGPDANHGTHVAGIIGAVRGNDVGMDGIANNVRIMSVRCVPDGDERDKDVANAIRYAVDNGASIINMSFGKSYVWNKDIVDEAVRYAMKKDVLLVHAAGNDGNNTDEAKNFPNDKFRKKGLFRPKYAKNWIEVGALHWKGGESLAAPFSNYAKENVDIFAPGVDIYSTVVNNEYDSYPGTSMASPMVAGVAAVLRSYYPTLTAQQVKEIILGSASKNSRKVKKPGTDGEMVPFSELSVTGGTLNAYDAVKMAAKTKGKKKIKKSKKVEKAMDDKV